ncbi:hypothetical protein VNI00_018140 [Paramarasmius palmivorus]|uniref:Integrase core domain-containing protein n=1 Tax=Paramarasmius palmivorus TaxID=297713 RepID=A0AAW0AZZ5_9AGAR
MQELRQIYPNNGYKELRDALLEEKGIAVTRRVFFEYCAVYEPDLLRQRRRGHGKYKRKNFYCAGVMDLIVIDQHDKWKYLFGLALHTGLDPYPNEMLWLKIWWNNNNPMLILSYYITFLKNRGATSLITQSDLGTENVLIARAHTYLRHRYDPGLEGTLQHRYKGEKQNVKLEIAWSLLRKTWVPGFEQILQQGLINNWYNPINIVERLVFRWVFIPWLQAELDFYMQRWNGRKKRRDKKKILPHGVPNEIAQHPERFGAVSFAVKIEQDTVKELEEIYIEKTNPVFYLVPPEMEILLKRYHQECGSPMVNRQNCWDVYKCLMVAFSHEYPNGLDQVTANQWTQMDINASKGGDDRLPDQWHSPPQRMFSDGTPYLGGAFGGIGPGTSKALLDPFHAAHNFNEEHEEDALFADFSDEEPDKGPYNSDYSCDESDSDSDDGEKGIEEKAVEETLLADFTDEE